MTEIIKATLADAKLIADVGATSFIESHQNNENVKDVEAYVSAKYTLNAAKEELSNTENIYHVIYYKNEPVGYSKIVFNCSNPDIPTVAVTKMDRLYLLKQFYDLKLGSQLLKFNIELSKKANQTGMWLNTWIKNERALAFYKKAGFIEAGKMDFKISETRSNPNLTLYLKY